MIYSNIWKTSNRERMPWIGLLMTKGIQNCSKIYHHACRPDATSLCFLWVIDANQSYVQAIVVEYVNHDVVLLLFEQYLADDLCWCWEIRIVLDRVGCWTCKASFRDSMWLRHSLTSWERKTCISWDYRIVDHLDGFGTGSKRRATSLHSQRNILTPVENWQCLLKQVQNWESRLKTT